MRIGQHETHPAADAYPLLEGDDFKNFTAGIEQDGQREEIVLLPTTDEQREDAQTGAGITDESSAGALVLDGRNRYLACLKLGIEPRFRYFDEEKEGDPIGYVKSKNNDRRHQERISRVLSLTRIAEIFRKGQRKRNKDQGALPGVDMATTEMVKRIDQDGSPELVAAVHAGDVDAATGAALSQLEPDEQRAGIERIKAAQVEPEKPVRATQARAGLVIELTDRDAAALITAMRMCSTEMAAVFARCDKSVHPEAVEGGKVLKRIITAAAGA